ncbi:mucin-16-like [Stegostoma tigrinum]|uniref:mucin-16-like n=1 Tax=Stegostoma tigrinum TaxID=3053191 RepID=UPI0028708B4D|nr:mucin-16-like [Stegostoma tigrinum]
MSTFSTAAVPPVTATKEPNVIDYNVTFIINRPTFQDIESNSSNQTSMIANELNDLFKNSSINAMFSSCRFRSFSMVDGDSSTVTVRCFFKNDSTIQDVNRELVYHVFENKTKDVSMLGPYMLDSDSLYVNAPIPLVTPTVEPKLTDYNVTFIISSPSFQDIESNSSNQTSMIENELSDLFENSKINATFSSCRFHSFSMVAGDSSAVAAICSFRNESNIQDIDRVFVYHVFENKTKNVSRLGPYTLDNDSLYVNGYHETRLVTTVIPTVKPKFTDYNVTFIISSPSFQDIESNSSTQARMIANELNDLFKNCSINATFSSCRFHSFSMVNGESSTVTAICSFRNNSSIQDVDRELVYHAFENKTKDVSNLGPYTLYNDSLFVNGYHEERLVATVIPLGTPTVEPELTDYNVTFIINNPSFQDIESNSSNQTSMIANELNDLFQNSSINATFSSCKFHSLRMAHGDSSLVTAICYFKNDSAIQDVDLQLVYHVFENKTKDVLRLGPYTLDNDSLYVNDYHDTRLLTTVIPLITPTVKPKLTDYNVTFIISSPSLQDIESNSSNQTSMIVNELNDLFKNSNINTTFSSCRFHSFSMVAGDSSAVTAICSFRNDSTIQDIDRVFVYHVFENKTKDVSKLGPHTLDNDSLYVNGYHETRLVTTVISTVKPKFTDYNVTFIISSPSFQDIESNSSTQARMIANELNDLYKNRSTNATFSGCRFHSFSMVNGESSTVTAICSFRNDSTIQDVNRELVYHAFENKTKDVSNLGPYTLDNDSLFVNGYHEERLVTTVIPLGIPTVEPELTDYNVTFIINSPPFQGIESNSSNQTSMIANELNDLFKNSSINATFSSCKFHLLSMAHHDSSTVTAICYFKNDSAIQGIDKELVYHLFENKTKDVSKLGPYTLDNDSLYVNDYHETRLVTTVIPLGTPTVKPKLTDYNVTFIISSPSFQDIESNSSTQASMISNELNDLFKNSSINVTFSSCRFHSFSIVDGDSSSVTATCFFKNDSTIQDVDRELVYHVFENKTKDVLKLGPYTLDNDSLYVNDYHESHLASTATPVVSVTVTSDKKLKPVNYNVTFIINNPGFEHIQSNSIFGAMKIGNMLNHLFKNSSIKATFSRCSVHILSMINGDRSRVTAICAFKPYPEIQHVDRILVYHVFENKTKDISNLGPYTLDSDSLYVNDYHETLPLITEPPIVPEANNPIQSQRPSSFNVTFTIDNLPLIEQLHDETSELYKSASNIVTHKLNELYRGSKIKAAFSKCTVGSLSETTSQKTKVYAMCTFNNNSTAWKVDRVIAYHQFSYNTMNITTLEPYSLDPNSLYVDDYHESTPTIIQAPNQKQESGFNVTFTIINLPYIEELHVNTSRLYRSASTIITYNLNTMFDNGDIKTAFTDCRVISLSGTSNKMTKVYAICSFRNNSAAEQVDRVTVYRQFNYKTKNITTLRPYFLDRNSLYVNDYHESTPPNGAPNQEPGFNVTFIVTNLPFIELLHDNTSQLYQTTLSIIANELDVMFRKSDISSVFADCRVMSLSATNSQMTNVYAVCSFKNKSDTEQVDRVTVYHQFNYETENITKLGAFSLDRSSLYVNDYHESMPVSTQIPIQQPSPDGFNVTFTVTSLPFVESFSDNTSKLYQSASTTLAYELNILYSKSDISTEFTNCKVMSLSATMSEMTKVYAICYFNDKSAEEQIDRVTVYYQFNYSTENITKLGIYSLDRTSLYVNGYHESISPTMDAPNHDQLPPELNVTFIVTNLPFMESLHDHTSPLYKSASSIITSELNLMYSKSDISSEFTDCKVICLSAASNQKTRVFANCSFNNISAGQVNRITVYHQFNSNTNNITELGPYSLDKNSLYVNGYQETTASNDEPPIMPVTQNPIESQKPLCFNVSFAITNLPLNPALFDTSSLLHLSASRTIVEQLNELYRNSKINAAFLQCAITSLSATNEIYVKVQAACAFKNGPQKVDEVTVKQAFQERTNNTSTLTTYTLESNSLLITGCEQLKTTVEPATAVEQELPVISAKQGDLTFAVNFTVINHNFTDGLQIPTSTEYKHMTSNLIRNLSNLFENSMLKDSYTFCHVTSLSPGSIKVSTSCHFDPSKSTRRILATELRSEFDAGTNGSRWLGRAFQLRSDSVSVEAMAPVFSDRFELPYWAIIVIVFAILLALFLITVLGLLIALCIRNRFTGFYNMLQDPFGIYYTHLEGK